MRLPDINDLIQDLQLAKQIAIDNQNANALTIATMSQAKLLGIDKPKIKDVYSANKSIVFNIIGVSPDDAAYKKKLTVVRFAAGTKD